MKYYISCKDSENSLATKNKLIECLSKYNYEYDEESPEYVIFIGGDGMFLRAVHKYIDQIDKVKFIGVRTGNLGFFCDYEPENIEELAKDLVCGVPLEYEYHLLEATLHFENKEAQCIYAVNEFRIENPFKTLVSDVYINNEHLEEFRGSGLLVSSTLGSTGYNKSSNGSVIDNNLNVIELTEINPINNRNYRSLGSSFVLGDSNKITFKGNFGNIVVGYDNKIYELDDKVTSVEVCSSDVTITVVRYKPFNFVDKLNKCYIK